MQPTIAPVYQLPLPNDKAVLYNRISVLIGCLNVTGFALFFLQQQQSFTRWLMAIAVVMGLLALAMHFFKIPRVKFFYYWLELSFFLAAGIWFVYGNIWLGLLLLLCAVMGVMGRRQPLVVISEAGVKYPSLPVKHFAWQQVAFVLIKDGILTIELLDNHIYQFTLDKQVADAINETNFNLYCSQMKTAAVNKA